MPRSKQKRLAAKAKTQNHRHVSKDPLLTRELLDFLALTAHQLRTPLSVIKGYTAMLIDGTYGEVPLSQKRAFETIYTTSERMIRLVNNFLDIPRMHIGKMEFNFTDVSPSNLLTHAIAEARLQADIKKIPILWEGSVGASETVRMDKENFLQAVMNILDNAIKYSKGGVIRVSLSKTVSAYLIKISDTGPGIPEKELPHLFDKFLRGDEMRKLYREGRGLGLYIAKEIINGHGGKVWAESEGSGKGSTFFIELPFNTSL